VGVRVDVAALIVIVEWASTRVRMVERVS